MLKGNLSALEGRHVKEFALKFINKFDSENSNFSSIFLDFFYLREALIDKLNKLYSEFLKKILIKWKVLQAFIYLYLMFPQNNKDS